MHESCPISEFFSAEGEPLFKDELHKVLCRVKLGVTSHAPNASPTFLARFNCSGDNRLPYLTIPFARAMHYSSRAKRSVVVLLADKDFFCDRLQMRGLRRLSGDGTGLVKQRWDSLDYAKEVICRVSKHGVHRGCTCPRRSSRGCWSALQSTGQSCDVRDLLIFLD